MDGQKFFTPMRQKKVSKKWQNAIKTGELFTDEMRYRRHDGVYRWHITRAQAMRDENGKILRWFGSNTDIDDVKASMKREHNLEKRALQLTEQRTQLIEVNKAKDEFIAVASHQLRTPATAVKQYLGMTLEGYVGQLSDVQKDMLSKAYESNERQIGIVNNLLHVASVDGGVITLNKESTLLSAILKESVDELRETIKERKQKVVVTMSKNERTIRADTVKMRMVFENILSNASKYSYENTTIKLSLDYDEHHARIVITDRGVGISKEDTKKLFKKFSRIDNSLSVAVGGTGLGLYWAHKIVELHEGAITVDSKLGKGTSFIISLPLGEAV